jgi:biotin transport system ATP-binding protein
VARRGVRTILSTHDLEVAADAQRTLLIHDGRVHADGTPAEVVAGYRDLVAQERAGGGGSA